MELGVSVFNVDFAAIAGIKYSLTDGKAAFQSTGKNSVGGSVLGPAVSVIFNQPLGIGIIRLRTPGSDPNACSTTPLLPGNACTDGDPYAIAGVVVGSDPGVTCASDSDCPKTAICTGSPKVCTTVTCTVDSDCNTGGGVAAPGSAAATGSAAIRTWIPPAPDSADSRIPIVRHGGSAVLRSPRSFPIARSPQCWTRSVGRRPLYPLSASAARSSP